MKKGKIILIVIASVVILAAGTWGILYIVGKKKAQASQDDSSSDTSDSTSSSSSTKSTPAAKSAGINAPSYSSTLKIGASGNDVLWLQSVLSSLNSPFKGFWTSGTFDLSTQSAVMAFQKSKGLTADGIVGPQTWNALDQSLNH
jgi:peptidoglycan hydrolase-like protein with peptidoglycan-binding domain